ncbi:MAG: cytochrome c [Dehalococcoidia bacterium]
MGGMRLWRTLLGGGLILALAGSVVLLGVACGGGDEATTTPSLTPTASPSDHDGEGKQLFISKQCAGCHGVAGEGTDVAPMIAGHNEGEVKRSVRNPAGNMPALDSDMLSDDELELIARYIESLESPGEHDEPTIMDEDAVTHHWMALYSLSANNAEESEHHVSHIVEVVTDPEHNAQMINVLDDMKAGHLHDAAHAIEEMLVGKADPTLTMLTLHLRLALADLAAEDLETAAHHIEHFIEMATDDEIARAEEILELLAQGNILDAQHEMEELLGENESHE